MINRRNLLLTAGAAVFAGARFAPRALAAGDTWSPLPSGSRTAINGVRFEAECGPNPTALQVSRSGVYRACLIPDNGWSEDDPRYVERAELDGWKAQTDANQELWSAWSMYYEKGPWSTSDWCILHQLYQIDGSTMAHILKPNGVLHWLGADAAQKGSGWPTRHHQVIEQDTWLNFVEVVRFDPEQGKGYWKSWVNGQQVLEYRGALGTKGVKTCYPKFGIYRGKTEAWKPGGPGPVKETIAVRYANMRFGTEDLSALIAKPDPIPSWEPWS